MRTNRMSIAYVRALTLLAMSLGLSQVQAQEAAPRFTVRDVNIYVMSAYGSAVNQRDLFRSTLPAFASPNRTTADRKHLNEATPIGLMTFEGKPEKDVDVLVEFDNGRFFAHWPPAAKRSKRLLWAHASLTSEAEPVPLPEGHWLEPLRKSDRLWFNAAHRSERFLLYDAELPLAPPVRISSAEDGYGLVNLGKYALHDVAIYRPEEGGWISASLPTLESTAKPEEKTDAGTPSPEAVFEDKPGTGSESAAPTATPGAPAAAAAPTTPDAIADPGVVAPAPLAAIKVESLALPSPTPPATPTDAAPAAAVPAIDEKVISIKTSSGRKSKDELSRQWHDRFLELGLGESEAKFASNILADQALRTDSATLVCRLGEEQLDTMLPLEITPAPDKQIRVAILVLLDADPDLMHRVDELIARLGDASYSEREAAKVRLHDLGPAARPKLQDAVNNSDPEISFRAEQILESLDSPPGT